MSDSFVRQSKRALRHIENGTVGISTYVLSGWCSVLRLQTRKHIMKTRMACSVVCTVVSHVCCNGVNLIIRFHALHIDIYARTYVA